MILVSFFVVQKRQEEGELSPRQLTSSKGQVLAYVGDFGVSELC